jgi:hypothetical protein
MMLIKLKQRFGTISEASIEFSSHCAMHTRITSSGRVTAPTATQDDLALNEPSELSRSLFR